LAEAFASTERDIAAALGDIPDEVFRAAAARLFAQLRDDAQTHLGTLLANDAERFWDEQVRARFTHDVSGRFPFALSAEDVDVKAVAALFAPTSGALWETERILNAAAEIAIAGKPIIRLNDQYRKTLTASKAVRDALFADFSDKAAAQNDVPHLTFTAEVRQRTGVFQALVAIGKETLDLHESPQARRTFGCVLTEPVACRIAIQVADGKWIEAASAPRPWGLLRWVAGSTPAMEANGRMVLSWNLVEAEVPPVETKKTDGAVSSTTAPVVPKTWLIQLVVDDGPAVALFSRRVFDNLSFPATIAVRHQEP
jgi:type VI protein secretion system component VasK